MNLLKIVLLHRSYTGIVNYAATKEGSGYQLALNLAREILPGGEYTSPGLIT